MGGIDWFPETDVEVRLNVMWLSTILTRPIEKWLKLQIKFVLTFFVRLWCHSYLITHTKSPLNRSLGLTRWLDSLSVSLQFSFLWMLRLGRTKAKKCHHDTLVSKLGQPLWQPLRGNNNTDACCWQLLCATQGLRSEFIQQNHKACILLLGAAMTA